MRRVRGEPCSHDSRGVTPAPRCDQLAPAAVVRLHRPMFVQLAQLTLTMVWLLLPLTALLLCGGCSASAHPASGRCSSSLDATSAGCAESDPSAQSLHLSEGEEPRLDRGWGGGLIPTQLRADVFVAGGGSAGTSAAIAAARSGASVVLAHGRSVLGGNSGSEVRVTMVGACGPRAGAGDAHANLLDCREGGIVEEYTLDNAANNPDGVPELFSLELLTLIKAEPNITLLLNTWLVSVETTSSSKAGGARTISSARCEDQQEQRAYVISAKVYIDTTGDGRLGAEAGAEWRQGREAQSEYNESLAVESADNETEGSSIIYMAEDKGVPTVFTPPFWAAKYDESQFRYRSVGGTVEVGYWWNEISWPYNTVTDGNNVTDDLITGILGIWDYVKNSGQHPDSETMGLTWVGQVAGKREGRRFVGQHVMSQNEVMAGAVPGHGLQPNHAQPQEPELFWDRVSYSGWGFDLHNPKGMKDPDHPPFVSTKMPYMFSTPLRSLVSKDLTNLFFAGRLSSFSHVVYGSQRVMKTCAAMGQAAGTAAAYSTTHGIDPIALQDQPLAVWSIQQQLIRDDALLIGVTNEDPRDHARCGAIILRTHSPQFSHAQG